MPHWASTDTLSSFGPPSPMMGYDGDIKLEQLREGADVAMPPPVHLHAEPAAEKPPPQMPPAAAMAAALAREAEMNYKPKTFKFWAIMTCNFLSLLLVALDRTILATAIPAITDEFHSLGDIGWYGSAYMLTTASFQLIFGRIFRFYDLRYTYLVCLLIFEIGSTICAAAPNSPIFIVGRAVAGLGSAGIMTGSMLVTVPMVPLYQRPKFQGMCL